jgi:hypothetical protein
MGKKNIILNYMLFNVLEMGKENIKLSINENVTRS